MSDTLEIIIAGRIMLGAPRHGVSGQDRIRLFARSIIAVVDHHHPGERPGLRALEPLLKEQLDLLERSVLGLSPTLSEAPAPAMRPDSGASEAGSKDEEASDDAKPREPVVSTRSAVPAKPLAEKLQEQRAPVQQLLRLDCVNLGLIDLKQAEKLVQSMAGKPPEEGERDVVEVLRKILQDHVKGIVRRLKGGPWSTPQSQEEMRQDIGNARSVRSIILLTRQVIKERHAWEAQGKGRGGILSGLFGSRGRLAG